MGSVDMRGAGGGPASLLLLSLIAALSSCGGAPAGEEPSAPEAAVVETAPEIPDLAEIAVAGLLWNDPVDLDLLIDGTEAYAIPEGGMFPDVEDGSTGQMETFWFDGPYRGGEHGVSVKNPTDHPVEAMVIITIPDSEGEVLEGVVPPASEGGIWEATVVGGGPLR